MKKHCTVLFAASLIVLSSPLVYAKSIFVNNATKDTSTHDTYSIKKEKKWLGVRLSAVPPSLKSQLKSSLNNSEGVLVEYVQDGSPAALSGIQTFDIITKFNNEAVYTADQLALMVKNSQLNQDTDIEVIRQGSKRIISTRITTRSVDNLTTPNHPTFNTLDRFSGFNHPFFNSPFMAPQWGSPFSDPFSMHQFRKPSVNNQAGNKNSWSQSESLSINTLANGRMRAKLTTKDTNNEERSYVFEGKKDEIISDIKNQKNLPEQYKSQLLGAIDGSLNRQTDTHFMNDFFSQQGFNRFNVPSFGMPSWQGSQKQNRALY